MRKQLIEYDDVMNQQREMIYRQRREALFGGDLKSAVMEMIEEGSEEPGVFADERTHAEDWDFKGLNEPCFGLFNFRLPTLEGETLDGLTQEGLAQLINDEDCQIYE